jgi:flavodoxin
MDTLVVYDSQYGNTQRIAEAIADAMSVFGQSRAVRADPALPLELQGVDLLIVGCPTQGWRPTPAISTVLQKGAPEQLRGVAVACFDTRFRMPRWLTGSAARVMGRMVAQQGATLLVPPESFFVQGREGPLLSGELKRAYAWAQALAKASNVPQQEVL